ncbi:MAG: hypothetical protein WD604_01330 [Balneolaceae bacterium]
MSDKFTKQEKTAIALQASSGDEKVIRQLAQKHDVSVEQIQSWVREMNVSGVEEEAEFVSLEASDYFIKSVEHGVTYDHLNYRRLVFWITFGSVVLTVIVVAIIGLYGYTFPGVERERSEVSRFYDIQQLEQNTQSRLETFGVIDPEEGIYRIPVDSAISIMAEDFE